jgi:hypothetical protein
VARGTRKAGSGSAGARDRGWACMGAEVANSLKHFGCVLARTYPERGPRAPQGGIGQCRGSRPRASACMSAKLANSLNAWMCACAVVPRAWPEDPRSHPARGVGQCRGRDCGWGYRSADGCTQFRENVFLRPAPIQDDVFENMQAAVKEMFGAWDDNNRQFLRGRPLQHRRE